MPEVRTVHVLLKVSVLSRHTVTSVVSGCLGKMEEFNDVYSYLESCTYPEGLSKDAKRKWRRKCKENFKIENGQLYRKKSDRKPMSERQDEQEKKAPVWRLCIKTTEEKRRILKSSHSSATGMECESWWYVKLTVS